MLALLLMLTLMLVWPLILTFMTQSILLLNLIYMLRPVHVKAIQGWKNCFPLPYRSQNRTENLNDDKFFCTSADKSWYGVCIWPPILKQNINTLNFNRGRNIEWQFDGIQGRPRLRSVGKTNPVAKSISHFSKSNFQKDSVSSHTGKSKLRQGILTEYIIYA